jgi:hypothetical protein
VALPLLPQVSMPSAAEVYSGYAIYWEPDEKEEIERRMDELAREYGRLPRGDPRREEIADQLAALAWRLDHRLI